METADAAAESADAAEAQGQWLASFDTIAQRRMMDGNEWSAMSWLPC